MTHRQKKHRPIMGGIAIKRHGASPGLGTEDEVYYGTLTAVARRKSDLAKVLVACLHIITGDASN